MVIGLQLLLTAIAYVRGWKWIAPILLLCSLVVGLVLGFIYGFSEELEDYSQIGPSIDAVITIAMLFMSVVHKDKFLGKGDE